MWRGLQSMSIILNVFLLCLFVLLLCRMVCPSYLYHMQVISWYVTSYRYDFIDALIELRCLYLQKNLIQEIKGLDSLQHLSQLNLSHNNIKTISGLPSLHSLGTLQLTHNRLKTVDDLKGLLHCPSLSIADVSYNRIDDPEVIDVFAEMPVRFHRDIF